MEKYFAISLLLVLFSCSTIDTDISYEESSTAKISIDFLKAEELDFSEFFDSFKIIQLETTPRALLGWIPTIQIVDSDLYISNIADRKLYRYSTTGEFLNSYGLIGRGPGEVYSTSTFFIDSSLVYIHIKNKIVAYDKENSEQVRLEKKVPFWASSFIKQSEDSWLFYRPRITTDSPVKVWTTDSLFLIKKKLLFNDTTVTYTAKYILHIQKLEEQYYLYEAGIDTIYCYKEGELSAPYVIDLGKYQAPYEFNKLDERGRIIMRTNEEIYKYASIQMFYITSSEIWLCIYYKPDMYLVRVNRNDNSTRVFNTVINGPNLIQAAKLLTVHDNRMYWTIPDRELLNIDKEQITKNGLEQFYLYRSKLPQESNPFIIELIMNRCP